MTLETACKARRNTLICAAALLSATLAGTTAVAQPPDEQSDPPAAPRFETDVVVTPERGETPRDRAPAATVVLDAESLRPLPVTDLGEVASFIPGFGVSRPHFHVDRPIVSSRGFFGGGEAEYLLLLVDGVPLSDAESGLIDWSSVPSTAIRRVEAVRGPAAPLYGDSAIGGVIHVLTDRTVTGGHLTATAGSFGTFMADGSYGGRRPRSGFMVSGAARTTRGGIEHAGGHQYTGMGAIDGTADRLSWRWTLMGDTRTRDTPGPTSRTAFVLNPYGADPLYALDGVDRRHGSTALTLRYSSRLLRTTGRLHASVRDEDRVRTLPLAPGVGDRQAKALASRSVGGSVEGEDTYGTRRPLTIRIGLDLAREALDTSYRPVDSSGTAGDVRAEAGGVRHRLGLFASSAWDLAERLRLSAAVRRDLVDDSGFTAGAAKPVAQRAWTARGGVVVSLSDHGPLSLFAQVSRAFKAPTLEQLFDPRPFPDFTGGTFTISNRLLTPQRATNVEAGLSGGRRVRWHALAYHMDVDDEIDFDLRTFSYANIGQSRHRGIELDARVAARRLQPSVSYALTHVIGDTGRQLQNVPRHVVAVAADVDLAWAGAAFVRYRHARGAFLDDDNAFPIAGPSTVDLRLRRPVGHHLVFLDVLNVTAHRYEEYGFTLPDFRGGRVPYVYAGSPRAFRAGVTVRY